MPRRGANDAESQRVYRITIEIPYPADSKTFVQQASDAAQKAARKIVRDKFPRLLRKPGRKKVVSDQEIHQFLNDYFDEVGRYRRRITQRMLVDHLHALFEPLHDEKKMAPLVKKRVLTRQDVLLKQLHDAGMPRPSEYTLTNYVKDWIRTRLDLLEYPEDRLVRMLQEPEQTEVLLFMKYWSQTDVGRIGIDGASSFQLLLISAQTEQEREKEIKRIRLSPMGRRWLKHEIKNEGRDLVAEIHKFKKLPKERKKLAKTLVRCMSVKFDALSPSVQVPRYFEIQYK